MIKNAISILIALSFALNVFAGFRYLTQEIYKAGLQAGAQGGVAQVSQNVYAEYQKSGQVTLTRVNDKGEPENIILVPKK